MDEGEEPRILPHLLEEMRAQVEARAREASNNSLHGGVSVGGSGDEGGGHCDRRGDLVHSMIENYRSHVGQHPMPQSSVPPQSSGQPPPIATAFVVGGKTRPHLSRVVKKASLTTSRTHLPPVHSYSNPAQNEAAMNTMSHSQPCLNSSTPFTPQAPPQPLRMPPPYQVPPPQLCQQRPPENHLSRNAQDMPVATGECEGRSAASEIGILRQQVAALQRKCEKFEQLESAYQRIESEFEELLSQKERQSGLENSIVQKMQHHIEHLQTENQRLQRKVEAESQRSQSSSVAEGEEEQQHRNEHQRVAELTALSQQQKLEIEAQNTTLEEQRNHIDVLEKALSNAQERIGARERQMVDMAAMTDRCAQLQGLLNAATTETERAKQEWKRREAALCTELVQLRMRIEQGNSPADEMPVRKYSAPSFATSGLSGLVDAERRMGAMKSEIRDRDETIRRLETRVEELQSRLADGEERHPLGKDRGLVDERLLPKPAKWTEGRGNLDHRVRPFDQDAKQTIGGAGNPSAHFRPRSGTGREDDEGDNFMLLLPPATHDASNGNRQEGSGAAVGLSSPPTHEASSMWTRMEELRKKISERRIEGGKDEVEGCPSNIVSSNPQLLQHRTPVGNAAFVHVGQTPNIPASSSQRRLSALSLPRVEGPLASYIEMLSAPDGQERRRADEVPDFINSPPPSLVNRYENGTAATYCAGREQGANSTADAHRYGDVSRIQLIDKTNAAGYSTTIVEVNRDHDLMTDPHHAVRTGINRAPSGNTQGRS